MNQKEDVFSEKRHLAIPLETFVEIDVSEQQRSKILRWIQNNEEIGIFPYASGLPRLVLVNETKLDKWKTKEKR